MSEQTQKMWKIKIGKTGRECKVLFNDTELKYVTKIRVEAEARSPSRAYIEVMCPEADIELPDGVVELEFAVNWQKRALEAEQRLSTIADDAAAYPEVVQRRIQQHLKA